MTVCHFHTGDIAEIYYCNPDALVQRALARLVTSNPLSQHLNSTSLVSVTRDTAVHGVRRSRVHSLTCSVAELFGQVLDLGAVPKRSFFSTMAPHAASDEEREKLLELSRAEGTDLFFDYCVKEKRSYLDVLDEFRSVQPPLSALLSSVPVIQPRQYSIASSALSAPKSLDLCVAVVKYRTPYRRDRCDDVNSDDVLWVDGFICLPERACAQDTSPV